MLVKRVQVVKRCLIKALDQRFQSAGDLVFHLRHIERNLPYERGMSNDMV